MLSAWLMVRLKCRGARVKIRGVMCARAEDGLASSELLFLREPYHDVVSKAIIDKIPGTYMSRLNTDIFDLRLWGKSSRGSSSPGI